MADCGGWHMDHGGCVYMADSHRECSSRALCKKILEPNVVVFLTYGFVNNSSTSAFFCRQNTREFSKNELSLVIESLLASDSLKKLCNSVNVYILVYAPHLTELNMAFPQVCTRF